MTELSPFEKLILDATKVFRNGSRKDDDAVSYSIGRFIACLEDGLPYDQASNILTSTALSNAFIEETRQKINAAYKQEINDITIINLKLLEKTHANSEKTLSAQNEMRTETTAIFGIIRDELTNIKDATSQIKGATEQIKGATENLNTASKGLVDRTEEMAQALKTVVKSTSTRVAITVGCLVGVGVGIPTGLITNKLYENYFSAAAQQQGVAAQGPQPPDKDTSSETLPVTKRKLLVTQGRLFDPDTRRQIDALATRGEIIEITVVRPERTAPKRNHKSSTAAP